MLYYRRSYIMSPVVRRMRNRIGRGLTFEKMRVAIQKNADEVAEQREKAD
jgi:hypothetical protein